MLSEETRFYDPNFYLKSYIHTYMHKNTHTLINVHEIGRRQSKMIELFISDLNFTSYIYFYISITVNE